MVNAIRIGRAAFLTLFVIALHPIANAGETPMVEHNVKLFLSWTASSGIRDEQNPYRKLVIEEGEPAVRQLLRDTSTLRSTDDRDIWILGEIGSPIAFPFLLSEYAVRPSRRCALSLGACLQHAEVEYLVSAACLTDVDRRALLEILLEDRPELQGRPLPDLHSYLSEHLSLVKTRCMLSSRPQAG